MSNRAIQHLTASMDVLRITMIVEAAKLRVLVDALWASDPELLPFRYAVAQTDLAFLDDHAVIRALIHAARDGNPARFLLIATEHGMAFTASHAAWSMFQRVVALDA